MVHPANRMGGIPSLSVTAEAAQETQSALERAGTTGLGFVVLVTLVSVSSPHVDPDHPDKSQNDQGELCAAVHQWKRVPQRTALTRWRLKALHFPLRANLPLLRLRQTVRLDLQVFMVSWLAVLCESVGRLS